MRTPVTNRTATLLLAAGLAAAGCAGWRGASPPPPLLAERFAHAPHDSLPSDLPWWTAFGDTTLNRFISESFAQNLNLERAVARLDQFRAARAATRSSLFPAISAQGSVSRGGEVDPSGGRPFELLGLSRFSVGLTAAYEMDFWGRLHAGRAAAQADRRLAEEELLTVAWTLAASVARTYYLTVELHRQGEFLDRTIESYEDAHRTVLERYRGGIAPSLDVYQAQTNLAGARAQRSLNLANRIAAEHALCILLGRAPRQGLVPPATAIPLPPGPPAAGLPSQVVQSRPDVRAALWRLRAADHRAAQAIAERLPTFTLTGSITDRDDKLSEVLDPEGMIWRAIGSLVLPLFEGGKRKANADRAAASYREQAASYQLATLTALQEVEDALARSKLQREVLDLLGLQVDAAEASLNLAMDRYLQGLSDYLAVMVAQTAYLNARRSQITAQRGLVDLYIGLATAVGGPWAEAAIANRRTGASVAPAPSKG